MTVHLFYFQFLFSGHFCSVDPCVVLFLVAEMNFFSLSNEAFERSYRGIDAIFNASESSSSFFSCHILSVYMISRV